MKDGSSRAIVGVMGTAIAWLLSAALATGQTGSADKPLMAEDVFKNVLVLRGLPVNEFMATMGIFSAALGMSCEDCHAAGGTSWEDYAIDNPRKQTTRRMVQMMATINQTNFGGRQLVTCYACHRGSDRPKTTPNLATLYGSPPPDDPTDFITPAPGAPPADQILDTYIEALGGAQRLAGLTSFTAKGFSVGYGPEGEMRPVEISASAPNRRTTTIVTAGGESVTTYDGRAGWISAPFRPVPVIALSGHELEGVRLDAVLSFPAGLRQALTGWRVGFPTVIDDREVQVVQGTTAGGVIATLYFDEASGLLVRYVRYGASPVGRLPTLVDFADYREVAGVKMPFRWTVTWLDGRDEFELSEVQPNVAMDAAAFARPAPPVPPEPTNR
jgi:hypothetical protein